MPKNDVKVELYYSGVWNDITSNNEVYTDSPITISQGNTSEGGGFRPSQISMRLKNIDDKYRISNPMSPLYRLVGRNTPVRITVGTSIRGVCEVFSWKCDQTQDFRATPRRGNAWTDIRANGLLGRANKWDRTLRSPIYRSVMLSGTTPAEYWDMEVSSGEGLARSAVGGPDFLPFAVSRFTLGIDGSVLPPGGAPDFGSSNGIPGSDSLPNFQGGGTLYSVIRSRSFDGYAIDWFMQFEANSDAGGTSTCDVLNWTENGTYVSFTVNVVKGAVTVFHANAADAATLTSTGSAVAGLDVYDGAPHHFRYQVRQSGGNYLAQFYIDSALWATADNFVPGMAGTVASPTSIQWNPGEDKGDYMPSAGGHTIVWASGQLGDQPPVFYALNGWAIERATYRLGRILTEENIAYSITGTITDSKQMGVQKSDSLTNTIVELNTTEDGMLSDSVSDLEVVFRTLPSRYNQTAALTLYTTDFPSLPVEVTDDLDIHNIVTVKQRDGAEATAEDSTSYLGSADSPTGVGEEKDEVKVNLYDASSSNLQQHANWWLRRGTVDLPRYPELTLDLNACPYLADDVNALVPGDVIEIVGFRADVIRLYILGWTEVIGTHARKFVFTCKPDQQFNIALHDGDRRQESYTSTLNASYSNVATSMVVGFTVLSDQWSQDNEPYDWMVAGERITVTSMGAVTGTGPYTQTAAVVRSANGIIKSQVSGEPVHMHPDQQARHAI